MSKGHKKLGELGSIIRGIPHIQVWNPMLRTKGASESGVAMKPGPNEREVKLKALGKIISKGRSQQNGLY